MSGLRADAEVRPDREKQKKTEMPWVINAVIFQ